jgi:FtsP/CotA-like multicopper oxidase with cupredoxin domain
MIGFGYIDPGQVMIFHNTWDFNTYTMTYGGTYSGMANSGFTTLSVSGFVPPVILLSPASGLNISFNLNSQLPQQAFTWYRAAGSNDSYTFNIVLPGGVLQSYSCTGTSYTYTFNASLTGAYYWYVTDNSAGISSQTWSFTVEVPGSIMDRK